MNKKVHSLADSQQRSPAFFICFPCSWVGEIGVGEVFVNKKYRCSQSLSYGLKGGKLHRLDTNVDYFIVGYAKTLENRPIIERCDGQVFESNTRWIVDLMDLKEI